ncbi:MAG: hypothetical protein ACM3S0_07455 [Acidobacteriota bacterium]
MISLGILDIVIFGILIALAVYAMRHRQSGRFYLVAAIFVVFLIERLIPGALSAVGNVIHSIDRVNDLGPHLTINPIITFR